jgi:hypothetical protein
MGGVYALVVIVAELLRDNQLSGHSWILLERVGAMAEAAISKLQKSSISQARMLHSVQTPPARSGSFTAEPGVVLLAIVKPAGLQILLIAGLAFGCGKKIGTADGNGSAGAGQPTSSQTPDTSASAPRGPQPTAVPSDPRLQTMLAGADLSTRLGQLTTELRRYIAYTRTPPKSFEEFAAHARISVPPAPAGKKYAIADGKVVLKPE